MHKPASIAGIATGADSGEIEGCHVGSNVSIIIVDHAAIGAGPATHSHPYPETFVVLEGNVEFNVAGERITMSAGSVLVAPAGTPHRFANLGPGRLRQVDIHSSDRFITDWLDT